MCGVEAHADFFFFFIFTKPVQCGLKGRMPTNYYKTDLMICTAGGGDTSRDGLKSKIIMIKHTSHKRGIC